MAPPAGKTTLVVGIDFGTTFSGVSWLICKPGCPPGQPEVISLWQTSPDNRRDNSDSQKVPTKIHYNEKGEMSWGFKVPAGAETIEWFKLLLLKDEDLRAHLQDSPHLHDAKKSLEKIGKTAVQLVGEYLKVLWSHSLKQICNAKGQDLISGMPIKVVLTVPAIWPEYARNRMREAAKLAGILEDRKAGKTTFSFISEPEAAAIATAPELSGRADLKIGDSFIVVDVGGGTLDIISYKLNKLEPLSVSECVEGDGALCGGTFLDKEFETLLKIYIGKAAWDRMDHSDLRRLMNNEWEHGIKKAFNGEPDDYTVEIPGRAQCPVLELSSDELQPLFNKISSQICELIKKQVFAIKEKTSQPPKLVILVGGFGRSPHLFKYIRAKLPGQVALLQARGDKPWTAICRGAALSGAPKLSSQSSGTQPMVKSRIARANYGWDYIKPFQEGAHDPRDKFWNPVTASWYARKQMKWIVKRGEDISLTEAKTYENSRRWLVSDGYPRISPLIIYSCTDENPPTRKEDNLKVVSKVTLTIPNDTKQLAYKLNAKRVPYYEWPYKLKAVVSGASVQLNLISDGKELNMQKFPVDVA
ncbi:hypothetical protein F5Y14DRAFT_457113 [Nemania sp. NC0429]|nr:hypothetical protein F5Y14DRAFT_457113 [Nemania sp. NC0429]